MVTIFFLMVAAVLSPFIGIGAYIVCKKLLPAEYVALIAKFVMLPMTILAFAILFLNCLLCLLHKAALLAVPDILVLAAAMEIGLLYVACYVVSFPAVMQRIKHAVAGAKEMATRAIDSALRCFR